MPLSNSAHESFGHESAPVHPGMRRHLNLPRAAFAALAMTACSGEHKKSSHDFDKFDCGVFEKSMRRGYAGESTVWNCEKSDPGQFRIEASNGLPGSTNLDGFSFTFELDQEKKPLKKVSWTADCRGQDEQIKSGEIEVKENVMGTLRSVGAKARAACGEGQARY